MQFAETSFPGVLCITPDIKEDARGFFMEVYRKDTFTNAGFPFEPVQVNHSFSKKNVVRGLHIQWDPPLGKLIRAIRGTAFAVVVDCHKRSKTVGRWICKELSTESKRMLLVPPGFASGFCALTEDVEIEYLYTALYNPKGEGSIRWDDPDIGIQWPVQDALLSPRDLQAKTFSQWLADSHSDVF